MFYCAELYDIILLPNSVVMSYMLQENFTEVLASEMEAKVSEVGDIAYPVGGLFGVCSAIIAIGCIVVTYKICKNNPRREFRSVEELHESRETFAREVDESQAEFISYWRNKMKKGSKRREMSEPCVLEDMETATGGQDNEGFQVSIQDINNKKKVTFSHYIEVCEIPSLTNRENARETSQIERRTNVSDWEKFTYVAKLNEMQPINKQRTDNTKADTKHHTTVIEMMPMSVNELTETYESAICRYTNSLKRTAISASMNRKHNGKTFASRVAIEMQRPSEEGSNMTTPTGKITFGTNYNSARYKPYDL